MGLLGCQWTLSMQPGQAAVTIASALPRSGELSLPLANEQRLLPPSATGNHARIGINREVLQHEMKKIEKRCKKKHRENGGAKKVALNMFKNFD